jgi:hypothetical protein
MTYQDVENMPPWERKQFMGLLVAAKEREAKAMKGENDQEQDMLVPPSGLQSFQGEYGSTDTDAYSQMKSMRKASVRGRVIK